jgi:hypothetical protein
MKRSVVFSALLSILMLAAPASAEVVSSASARVHHVVIVWLKDRGNPAARARYIEATESLAKLPMVWRYQIGTALPSDQREVVDSSYDVAIVATFENAKALTAYLEHPDHARILQEKLKPLVDKVIVYDFSEAP